MDCSVVSQICNPMPVGPSLLGRTYRGPTLIPLSLEDVFYFLNAVILREPLNMANTLRGILQSHLSIVSLSLVTIVLIMPKVESSILMLRHIASTILHSCA